MRQLDLTTSGIRQQSVPILRLALLIGLGALLPEAQATIIHVSKTGADTNDGQTWATAKQTVAGGIAGTVHGDQIWVSAGTYVEAIWIGDAIELYGGFAGTESALTERDWSANVTIIDGKETVIPVNMEVPFASGARLDGLTVRCGGQTSFGRAISCFNCSPIIANCTITSSIQSYGAGIYCYNGSPTITNCTITNLGGDPGAGIISSNASPTIRNCTITNNFSAARGGGIYCIDSSPTILNCVIAGNAAASATGGAIYCENSAPVIANCNLLANNATSGGGIYCKNSTPVIVNCTIAANSAVTGGGVYSDNSSPLIANTIVNRNTSGIYSTGAGLPQLRFNCVYGNTGENFSGLADPTGTDGNISVDPQLAALAFGNAHLQPDSPCRDTGDDALVQPGWVDIDSQMRIEGSHVDIGADESDGTIWPAGPYTVIRVAPDGNDANDGSSWASAKRTVQAAVDSATGGEVWVKTGTYVGSVNMRAHVHVYAGFRGVETNREQRNWATYPTTLAWQDQFSRVTISGAGNRVATLDGFQIVGTPTSAISVHDCSPIIANCTIEGNAKGGIGCSAGAPLIVNCVISGNRALRGGGINCAGASPMVVNCAISGNTADFGGGIYWSGAPPMIINTIVAFNSSGIYTSSVYTPSIGHNCVYGNTAYNYSGLPDPTGTNGNISVDPRFIRNPNDGGDGWGVGGNDDYGDARLQAGSPCIDAGDNAAVPADLADLDADGDTAEPMPFDLAGAARLLDDPTTANTGAGTPPIVDLGAYEYFLPVLGDLDRNGRVDAYDLTVFCACTTGPAVAYAPAALPALFPGCPLTPNLQGHIDADFDADGDVDQSDFGAFQLLLGS